MFIVDSYSLAVIFCVVTMLCWGSWGNTQKLVTKFWYIRRRTGNPMEIPVM